MSFKDWTDSLEKLPTDKGTDNSHADTGEKGGRSQANIMDDAEGCNQDKESD